MKNLKQYLEELQKEQISISSGSITPPDQLQADPGKKKNVMVDNDNLKEDKERIMIDFDGVLHSYEEGFKDGTIYGTLISGAKEAIDELKEKYEIVIFTTRASKIYNDNADVQVKNIKEFLSKNDVYFDKITSDKLGAKAYIDDRAIRFENNWSEILNKINSLKDSI